MRAEFSMFCVFLVGPIRIVHGPPRTEKRSHGFCYSVLPLENYFATVFLAISFQFLANKRYPNKFLNLNLCLPSHIVRLIFIFKKKK